MNKNDISGDSIFIHEENSGLDWGEMDEIDQDVLITFSEPLTIWRIIIGPIWSGDFSLVNLYYDDSLT